MDFCPTRLLNNFECLWNHPLMISLIVNCLIFLTTYVRTFIRKKFQRDAFNYFGSMLLNKMFFIPIGQNCSLNFLSLFMLFSLCLNLFPFFVCVTALIFVHRIPVISGFSIAQKSEKHRFARRPYKRVKNSKRSVVHADNPFFVLMFLIQDVYKKTYIYSDISISEIVF